MPSLRVRNPERIMFTLHRWTGIILLAYFTLHAITMGLSFTGNIKAASLASRIITNKPLLWIVASSAILHGLNGIRLLLVEFFGIGVGKPEIPRPPYISPSLRSFQRRLLYMLTLLMILSILAATYAIIVI